MEASLRKTIEHKYQFVKKGDNDGNCVYKLEQRIQKPEPRQGQWDLRGERDV